MLLKRLSDRMGFPRGSMVRNPPAHGRDAGNLGSISCGRKWQPTPVLSPGKFHEQRSLAGCRLGQSSFLISTVELNAENTATPTGGNRRPSAMKVPSPNHRTVREFPPWNRFLLSVTYCLQGNRSGRGNEESRVCSKTLQSSQGGRRV